MPTPPANPHVADARRALRPIILLGDALGNAPTSSDQTDRLKILSIHRSAGGRQLDYAVFEYDLGSTGERIANYELDFQIARQVEVRLADDRGNPTQKLLFWGEITKEGITIDRATERVICTARIEPYHFGSILEGTAEYDPVSGSIQTIHRDPLFNPQVDGKTIFNRAAGRAYANGAAIWIDPESIVNDQAIAYQGSDAIEWGLEAAVDTLQTMLNPDETFIRQQPSDELFELLAGGPPLRNVKLKRGEYLPKYLDQLLDPHGFSWLVRFSLDGSTAVKTLFCFSRSSGPEKHIFLQSAGQRLNLALTNAEGIALETSIADLSNIVVGQGSLEERQLTIHLQRGWPESQDAIEGFELLKSDPESQYAANPDAWRLWIANEDGAYNGLRGDTTTLDLSPYFTSLVPRRRKLRACLDHDLPDEINGKPTGKRARPVLEWKVGTEAWQRVPSEWGWSLLDDRIGIRFTGDSIPEELREAETPPLLRITGTVVGDHRVTATATHWRESPNRRDVKLFLDLSDRFHDRQKPPTSVSAPEAAPTFGQPGDIRNDTEALRAFCESVRDIEDVAHMEARFTLFGLHFEYEIGDLLTAVDGRNISLNRKSTEAEAKRYLQITSIVYDFQEQRTRIDAAPEFLAELEHRLNTISVRDTAAPSESYE